MSTTLERLAQWFRSQADGTWEQDWGVTLQTIDNPGWMLEVNLDGTPLYNAPFRHLKQHRGKDDWIECAIQDHGRAGGDEHARVFVAAGGPGNLEEIVAIFCDWAEQRGGPRPGGGASSGRSVPNVSNSPHARPRQSQPPVNQSRPNRPRGGGAPDRRNPPRGSGAGRR